jgi:non-ribosomal peptide synthetase component E (peptide arylation enzyme)
MISIGGAPPSLWSVIELKRRWGIDFCNIWGQNESAGIYAGPYDIPDIEKRIDHFPQWGKPGTEWHSPEAKYFRTKILDRDTRKELTEIGSVGELWYDSPCVIPCYFRNPEATAAAFDSERFFNTGDLFQIKDGNCVGFFDRTKDIIIRGGFNISAQEVENMILGYPKVIDAAAVSMPDENLGEKTCVFVVPREGEKVTLDEITSFMKKQGIASYKLPERLEVINIIPRNPVGKILKSVLREKIRGSFVKELK